MLSNLDLIRNLCVRTYKVAEVHLISPYEYHTRGKEAQLFDSLGNIRQNLAFWPYAYNNVDRIDRSEILPQNLAEHSRNMRSPLPALARDRTKEY